MHSLNWNDLQYVLAVATAGSAAAAARQLKVDHTTVIRRIKAFETKNNLRIFDHLATGYKLTSQGETFVEAALSIENTLQDLERKIAGGRSELEGAVRITTTDGIAPYLSTDFAALKRAFPTITLDILITNHPLDLDRLDAEIAIRASGNPPPELVGRRVCDIGFFVYGTAEYIDAAPHTDLLEREWLGMEKPISASPPGQWVAEHIPQHSVIMRTDSFISMRDLAAQGLGLAVLPCHIGDNDTRLRRVPGFDLEVQSGLWLLSHRDVLRSPSIRACADFLYQSLRKKRSLFRGG